MFFFYKIIYVREVSGCRERAWTILGSFLLPSMNSDMVSLLSLSESICNKSTNQKWVLFVICVNQSEKSIVLSQPMRREYLPAQISSQPWTWDLHPHHSDHPEIIEKFKIAEKFMIHFKMLQMKFCFSITYHHPIDSIYNVEHLMLGDVSIIINIIKTEGPWNISTIKIWFLNFVVCFLTSKFFIQVSPGRYW